MKTMFVRNEIQSEDISKWRPWSRKNEIFIINSLTEKSHVTMKYCINISISFIHFIIISLKNAIKTHNEHFKGKSTQGDLKLIISYFDPVYPVKLGLYGACLV